ncbi:MAG TPA: PHP domain-containing protein [Blastocatellia bacterium]|nr:PHP domain-containing protein [Blastocatellia bacterium]
MIIDMHVHTVASGDSLIAAEDLIDHALDMGLDGICVTEHDSYEASAAVEELAEGTDLKVFRGVEVSTVTGHMLVYGVKDDKWKDYLEQHKNDAQRLIDYVRSIDGVVIPAHPFDPIKPGIKDLAPTLAGVFAIEAFNGQSDVNDNIRAREMAERLNLSIVGGSDAHSLYELGKCVTEFSANITSMGELIAELKAGRFRGRYL